MDGNRELYKNQIKCGLLYNTGFTGFKFIVVGIINSAFGYAVFAFVFLISKNFGLSIIFAYTLGCLFNFMSAQLFLFTSSKRNPLYLAIIYCCFAVINYWLLIELLKDNNIFVLQVVIQALLAGTLYIILKILERFS